MSETTNDELLKLNASGISVERCIIDGNKSGLPDNEAISAIGVRAADCTVKDCIIFDTDRHGIQTKADNAKIRGNTIKNPDRHGIEVGGGSASVAYSGVDVVNNTVSGSTLYGIQVDRGVSDVTVSENRVSDTGDIGIAITDHGDTPPEGVDIRGNQVINSGEGGIASSLSNTPDSVRIVDNYIDGGTFTVAIHSSISNLTVRGNEGKAMSISGMKIVGCPRAEVQDNYIHDPDAINIGIQVLDANRYKLCGNRVYGVSNHALRVRETDGGSYVGCKVSDNIATGADNGVTVVTDTGSLSGYSITDNILSGNTTAINDTVGAGDAIVADNQT